MTGPLIAAECVKRSYDGGRVVALDETTLRISDGEFLAITGPSGSGKSTLLNILSGMDRPDAGHVAFEGTEPRTNAEWARLRALRIGLVFQRFNLLATLTARQNVELPMFGIVNGAKERTRRAAELLERVGLAHRASHRPHELSVGERQRVAIARSLANSPAVILADEPTGSLDSQSASSVMDLLAEIRASMGATLVVVTHDAGVAARAARQVRMRDGSIVADVSG